MTARLTIAVLVLALAAAPAAATTIVVDVGGSGDHTAINPAIAVASEGDTILVMPGTYTGMDNKNWDFQVENLVIRSSDGAATTTVDCEGSNGIFQLFPGETGSTTVIEGFTFTGGHQVDGGLVYIVESSPSFIDCVFSASSAAGVGGAAYLYDSTSSFTGCVFTGNTSPYGGAMQIQTASPTFTDCQFTSNVSTYEAGAIDCIDEAAPTFTECTFSGNDSPRHGGGLRCDGGATPALTDCYFLSNSAYYSGGGVFCNYSSSATFEGCLFDGNSAEVGSGGGLACLNESACTVYGCTFLENTAGQAAGGAYADEASPSFTSCVFMDNEAEYGGGVLCYDSISTFNGCFFIGNYSAGTWGAGGGLYCEELANPVLTNCTFYDNGADVGGGHVECYVGSATLNNCLLAFSNSGPAVNCFEGTEVATLQCCDVYGNAGGDWVGCIALQDGVSGNMSEDPLFCDMLGGDLTIDVASPCTSANSGGCGLIGALDIGCDTAVEATSWGAIKARYR
jgi:hypothetical protein